MSDVVVLTGGTGYLGSRILRDLLKRDYKVRLTTRNVEKTNALEWLKKLKVEFGGQLSVFYGDLTDTQSFDKAMKGADYLIHAASPFKIEGIKDAKKELVDPAVNGTENVLAAADNAQTIKKVVLTSSVAAIYGDAKDIEQIDAPVFNESHWNTSSSISHQPYSYSKVAAEKAAWSFNEGKEWDLVTINPGFIMGPTVSERKDSTSIKFMVDMVNGKFKMGVPDLYFSVVDVRDVSISHIKALESPKANGRYVCTNKTMNVLEIAQALTKVAGHKFNKFPSKKLPHWLTYLVAPFLTGFSWGFLNKNLGVYYDIDNGKIKSDLGIYFKNIEETLMDHVEQIEADGLVKM